jgi:RNA polymerase sigma-70 factor, ECF subfamily
MKQFTYPLASATMLVPLSLPSEIEAQALDGAHPVWVISPWFSLLLLAAVGVAIATQWMQTDQELLQRICRQADQSALVKLLHRYRGFIQSVAYRLGHGKIDLDDLQQDLYLLLLDKLPGQEPPRYFKAWLSTLLRNRLIDAHRHEQTRQRYEEWYAWQPSSYEDQQADQLDQSQFVVEAMQHLTHREAAVIKGHFLEEKSYQEVADELQYSFKQVTGVMYRGMKRLRREMGKHSQYFQQ